MSWNWCCLSDLCWNWCHGVSNAEKITLEKLPNLQEIRLKQGNQRWYFTEQISKKRILVSPTTKGYEWMVWKNENNYAIFGKMVQEEGAKRKVRFITKGRTKRLFVGDEEDESPIIDLEITDPRVFQVVGTFQRNGYFLKHCKSGLNVMVHSGKFPHNEDFLIVGDLLGQPWEMFDISSTVCQESEHVQQQEETGL